MESKIERKIIMSANKDYMKKILKAHVDGDSHSFYSFAKEYVNNERKKRNHVYANELDKILENTKEVETIYSASV